MNPIYTQANVPTGAAPAIGSFSATPTTAAAGTSVTLNWTVSNASYAIISPQIGPVRGSSITVTPGQTTTYTLYATNQYGQSQATLTVVVQQLEPMSGRLTQRVKNSDWRGVRHFASTRGAFHPGSMVEATAAGVIGPLRLSRTPRATAEGLEWTPILRQPVNPSDT